VHRIVLVLLATFAALAGEAVARPDGTTEVAAELRRRHFTVGDEQAHVKVAWKVTAQTVARKEER
jgi:hypothetical protein